MASIALHQVVKEFPGRRGRTVRAIDQLSLAVATGQWLAVVGPSGSGKTTLLRLIAGLEAVTSGTVLIDDRAAPSPDPSSLDFAMVFQRDALLPHLTARENIALGLRLRGHDREEIARRIREADELFHLGDGLDRLPRALSGGERQRAALARAFVRRPRAILLDEPLSNLDAPFRAELRAQLREFHRRLGVTVVHVTHDQNEAMALGGQVAVIRHGVLQQIADPRSLYRAPTNAFVAGFVGFPPMNLFRGRLVHHGGAVWFHAEDDDHGLSLCLTEAQGAGLGDRGLVGQEILLGLRAEHILDCNDRRAAPFGCEVKAVTESVEHLGAETHVQWRCGRSVFVSRKDSADAPAVRVEQTLVFDLAKACFFDVRSGAALAG